MDQLLRKLFELIHSYSNFILVTHLNPDIDGIASMLSLHLIDHHQLDKNGVLFSENELVIIDPSSPSTTYLIYKIFENWKIPISSEMAQNLLSGIYFDTGCFKYENVNEETFSVASKLCKLGAIPHIIASSLFENISLEELEMLKLVLQRLEFLQNGIIAISYLTYQDIQKFGSQNLSDVANFLRSIKGVKVSALLKEVEKNMVSVSLRSRAPFEILDLAKNFGGGGHKYACGFKIKVKNFYEFLNSFKEILRSYHSHGK
jgi:phosphoesterase RecJ-like protein